MLDKSIPSPAFAAVHSSLSEARARVSLGKTQAASASTAANAWKIHDRFLVNGIVMLTNTLRGYSEPALNLQRAAWTLERPTRDNGRFTERDKKKVVMRDVDAVLQHAVSPFAFPLSGHAELVAFTTIAHYLETHSHYNEALLLLEIAENEHVKLGVDDNPMLDNIRMQQTQLITGRIERIDDQLASRTIEPCRLPPAIGSAPGRPAFNFVQPVLLRQQVS